MVSSGMDLTVSILPNSTASNTPLSNPLPAHPVLRFSYIVSRPGARIVKAGKTSFDAEERPKLIKPFTKNKIIKVACGAQHALAMDEEGFVWGWGYAGYSRLGLGDQKDRYVETLGSGTE